MTARDLLADGDLTGAVAVQRSRVFAAPDDPAARLFLFELLALAGKLLEARDELRLIDSPAPDWPAQRRRFVHVLKAEYRRTALGRPGFLHPPPAHARHRRRFWSAVVHGATPEVALRRLDRADAAAPHLSGHLNGREFDGLRDADDRFAGVLEAFVGRHYVWFPLDTLRRIRLDPSQGVLDEGYRPGRLLLATGDDVPVVLPLTYPGSAAAGDAFALGRDADWPDHGGPVIGVGAKVLLVGDEEEAFSDVRQIDLVTSGS